MNRNVHGALIPGVILVSICPL